MYKLSEHLKNVRAFAINDVKEFALIKDNSFYLQKGNEYLKYYDFPMDIDEIYYKEYFIARGMWGDKFFFNDGKIEKVIGLIGFLTKKNMLCSRIIDDKTHGYVYNLETKQELPYKNPINVLSEFIDGAVYQRKFPSKTILEKVSLIDNQIVWQTNLKTLGKYFKKEYEIIRVIGIHNGELLVGCSNNVLLAVNHETGEIIYQWQALEHTGDYRFPKSKIGSYHSALLLPNENKLVGGGNRSLWEIDLITRAIVVNDLAEEFTKNNINSLTGDKIHSANDTHLILTAYTNEDVDYFKAFLVIFALNKKTYNIDWIHNFGTAMTGTERKTEVAGNKLYQLDTDGNLFIFEKV